MSVVGIDFGYQTCFIAVARQGGIETIANEYSDRCTPSYVSYTEKQRFMGASSKNTIFGNIKNTVWGWKMLLGRRYDDPIVQHEKRLLPYEIVERSDGMCGIQVMYMGETQVFSPEQVSATMLSKLRDTAETALQIKVVDVVISVPVYFSDSQRRSMLDAAQTVGLNVLRLMNDTTATALAYGIYKQDLPAPEEKPRNVVFVDLGHADLQLSACAFNKGKLKVLATTADSHLGGRDLDLLLCEHFADDFKTRFRVDARSKPRAFVRLLQECEKLKKLMSANSTPIPLNIECFMDDKDVSGRLQRSDLESMAEKLLQRLALHMRAILDLANLKASELYSVEVVGGSSRVPAVKQLVKEVFGLEPSTTLNSDEAVARGCALQCAILSPTFRVRDFSIQDAQAYPITLHWQGGMDEDSQEMEVFSRFHQVPFSKMLTFYRREPFELDASYSAVDHPSDSKTIGKFKIDKVVPQANGESSKVKVKVRVNIHGIFTIASASLIEKLEGAEEEEPMEVEGSTSEEQVNKEVNGTAKEGEKEAETKEEEKPKDEEAPMETEEKKAEETKDEKKEEVKKKKKTVKSIDLPIYPQVWQMSPSELNLMVEKESQMRMADKLEKERTVAKNAVEEYVYDMRDKVCNSLSNFMKTTDRESYIELLEDTENWLYEDGEDCLKQVYVDKLAALKKIGQPAVERYREAEQRPAAFDEFGQVLQLIRKALDLYAEKDEKYAHIDQAEMDKVSKAVQEKSAVFDRDLNLCTSLQPHDDPPVTCSQIRAHKESLISLCNPILNKPKPKPKEEPPKDKAEPAATETAGEKTEKPEVAEDGDQQPEASVKTNNVDMELD